MKVYTCAKKMKLQALPWDDSYFKHSTFASGLLLTTQPRGSMLSGIIQHKLSKCIKKMPVI